LAGRRKGWAGFLLILAAVSTGIAATPARGPLNWQNVRELGATFSVYSYGQAPYNRSAPFLGLEERTRFSGGASAFAEAYPGSTVSANAATCEICHFRDGRGRAHAPRLDETGFSVVNPAEAPHRVFRTPTPSDSAAARLVEVRWVVARRVVLSSVEVVELVRPVAIINGVERPLDLRNAPGAYGLGLLEAIPEGDIEAQAHIRKYQPFGVSGRAAMAADSDGSRRIGRFGWKATFATLPGQVRNAAITELGLVEATRSDAASREGPAFEPFVESLTTYLRFLAVPARRLGGESSVGRGAARFAEAGCAMCHLPSWRTAAGPGTPETHRGLTIYPFTDLLLHDMGDDLRDPTDHEDSRHWRTAPLWGIGVQRGVSSEAGFLHDGRARTFTEAILWHGGEGRYAVERFKALSPQGRAELVAFLSSL